MRFNLLFTFPSAKAAHAQQYVSIVASNLGLAVNRGFQEIKKRPAMKGLRLSEGKITFTVEKDEQS